MMKASSSRTGVCERGPLMQILLFVLPLFATSVMQQLFNTADAIVVGRWGGATPQECQNALGAVGACSSLINLTITVFLGLATGVGVCFARFYGAGNKKAMERTIHTAVPTAILCGVIVALIGEVFADDLLILMGTPSALVEQATRYMRAVFLGTPASMIYNFCAAADRSMGDTKRPLFFLGVGGIANVILNLIAVVVFRLGALGVGIASAISSWISCVLILIFMMRTDEACHLDLRRMRIDVPIFKEILRIGIPSGVQGFVFAFSQTMIQSAVNSFDDPAIVAGRTAGNDISNYLYLSQNAFYHTALTYVGQSYGAKRPDKIRTYVLWCMLLSMGIGTAIAGLIFLFEEPLLSLFLPGNAAAMQYAKVLFLYTLPLYFVCGWMEIGSGTLRALGKSLTSMLISIGGVCGVRFLWILAVFPANRTLEVLFINYPITWIFTSLISYIFVAIHLRGLKNEDMTLRV